MTTLSDEEFQRLNNQLLELKVANYNLEASLNKSNLECSSVKGENELLRKQLAEQSTTTSASGGQSIKSKLNPFSLAKNIAHKVDARRINAGAMKEENFADKNNLGFPATTTLQPEGNVQSSSNNLVIDLTPRLEMQEAEFLKTNEMLKQEIVLLQKELQTAQENASKEKIYQQLPQKPVTTCDKSTEPAKSSNAELPHPHQLSPLTSTLSSSPSTTITSSSPYSPSRQLQQSLAQLTASLSTKQHKLKWVDQTGPLVDRFIDSLSLDDTIEQTAAIEALLQAVVFTTTSTNSSQQSLEEMITGADDIIKSSEDHHDNGLLDNTTEDFKQLAAFCGQLKEAQQAEAQAFLGQLAREVVKHNRRQREVFSESLAEEVGRTNQLKAEINRLQTEKAAFEATLEEMKTQMKVLETEKSNLKKSLNEQLTSAATEVAKQQKAAENELFKAQQKIDRLQAEVAEAANANKISEKRGLKIIKELTRQLAGEKKRAEKLQAMIISSGGNDPSTSNPNSAFQNSASKERGGADTASCSSGSWSYMAESQNSKSNHSPFYHEETSGFSDLEIVQSPSASKTQPPEVITNQPSTSTSSSLHPNGQANKLRGASSSSVNSAASSGTLEAENVSLLARISTLQQENWRLEEQVDQLQQELANKSRLIEFYCIRSDGRSGVVGAGSSGSPTSSVIDHGTSSRQNFGRVLSRQNSGSSSVSSGGVSHFGSTSNSNSNPVLRMVSFLKEKGEQVASGNSDTSSSLKSSTMMDVNRKLQHMVEEILTKNMHLQANLEELSNQLMEVKGRLKKYEPEISS